MYRLLLIFTIALCTSAEKYPTSKNNHEQPCLESETIATIKADTKVCSK